MDGVRKVSGRTQSDLEATLHKLQEANLTLNEEKGEFSKPSVEFSGDSRRRLRSA